MKTQQNKNEAKNVEGVLLTRKLWRLSKMLYLLVVPRGVYKGSITPFTKPNPVYSYTPKS
jgi:hypothetical protein